MSLNLMFFFFVQVPVKGFSPEVKWPERGYLEGKAYVEASRKGR